ncbi:hypothetical protein BKA66DRAFT_164313 [Pyrenochaeta sp. MPI-SDFR-AT-0127]|nr:hypothetical protein BKA66DRAFT_164313 [Pyrenochaeta sp. MPI-SDFR-AT-0127]
MQCELRVTPKSRHWPATRPALCSCQVPFGTQAGVQTSLLDALRAGDGATANSWNKSNLRAQQGLPTLWLKCRSCLSSPSAQR